jgi:hypothetical protein
MRPTLARSQDDGKKKTGFPLPLVFTISLCLVCFLVGRFSSTAAQCYFYSMTPESKNIKGEGQPTNVVLQQEDGWSQINVYYGNRQHLHVLPPREWKSQVGQDQLVYKMTNHLKGGFFVDLAANDASAISNSYSLETYHNWNGLCIEANPRYWNRLAYRKCTVVGAVVGHDRMTEIDFNFKGSLEVAHFEPKGRGRDRGAFGGIVKESFDNTLENSDPDVLVKRYTVPLIEIFERFNVPKLIDYFSLDVEGAETYIMESFPFQQYQFRIMSIERPKDDLKEILTSNGYIHFKTVSGFGETIWINENLKDGLNLE